MGIRDKIRGFMAQEKDKRQRYEEAKFKADTNELNRLKMENKAKAEREKVRLQLRQEKKKSFEQSSAGRFVKGLNNVRAQVQKDLKDTKKNKGAGQSFGSGINPAFSLGKDKPKKTKRKIKLL